MYIHNVSFNLSDTFRNTIRFSRLRKVKRNSLLHITKSPHFRFPTRGLESSTENHRKGRRNRIKELGGEGDFIIFAYSFKALDLWILKYKSHVSPYSTSLFVGFPLSDDTLHPISYFSFVGPSATGIIRKKERKNLTR